MRDPYTVLGVARGASEAEIKKAYRRIAKDNHPDRNAGNAAKLERFKEASAANTMLSDPETRGKFDRGEIDADGQPKNPFAGGGFPGGGAQAGPWGARSGAGGGTQGFEFGNGGGDAGDLFSELFGRGGRSPFGTASGGFENDPRRRAAPKGADVAYRLSVPFEEAAVLKPQRITLRNGKTLDLKLPPGFAADKPLRMGGQGESGAGGAGDALITLTVAAHRNFRRDGDDIRLDVPITLGEAVDGAKIKVPTVDGPVTLTIAPGTSSGRVLRLRGRGFTRADSTRGDQFLTIAVDLPADDAELRAFTARWHDARLVRSALGVD